MDNIENIISAILIALLGVLLLSFLNKEGFWPIWNMPTRYTRNMSYDLRGDVPIIPYHPGPWLLSPLMPDYWYYRPINGHVYERNFLAEDKARV